MRHLPNDRAAVIGAAGFLGSALSARLRGAGATEVASYTRRQPFLTSAGRLDDGVLRARTVFWLASSVRPATAGDRPDLVASDRAALESLIDRLGASHREARLVTVSSGGTVYDTSRPAPYNESSAVKPVHAYGVAMLDIERLVGAVPGSVVLRVSNAYGPGQAARHGQGVIAHWLNAVKAGQAIHLVGDDQVARDYVFIDDVVDALVAVADSVDPPAVVNVGSGRPTTLAQLALLVSELVRPHVLDVHRDPARVFDSPSTWLDVSLAAQRLGWTAQTPLRNGLELTWKSMVDQTQASDADGIGGAARTGGTA